MILDFKKAKDKKARKNYCTKMEHLKMIAIKYIIDKDVAEGNIDTLNGVEKRAIELLDVIIKSPEDFERRYELAMTQNRKRGV